MTEQGKGSEGGETDRTSRTQMYKPAALKQSKYLEFKEDKELERSWFGNGDLMCVSQEIIGILKSISQVITFNFVFFKHNYMYLLATTFRSISRSRCQSVYWSIEIPYSLATTAEAEAEILVWSSKMSVASLRKKQNKTKTLLSEKVWHAGLFFLS